MGSLKVWHICLALFALLASPARAITCPRGCTECTENKVDCPKFILTKIASNLDVMCVESYDFRKLEANSMVGLQPFTQLTFKKCPIPRNRSLVDTLAMLGPLAELKELFFVNNGVYEGSAPLEPVLFEGLNLVRNLSLKFVTRHLIQAPDLFTHLPQLEWLDLREYGGDSLPATLLQPLQAMHTLELGQNAQLKVLPEGFLANLSQLQTATIFGNGLTSLERFRGTPNLTKLDLSANQLGQLPEDIFADVPGLSVLNLRRNQLNTLPAKLFAGLNELRILDLSHNGVRELPSTLLRDQHQLTNLSLSFNKLKSLDK